MTYEEFIALQKEIDDIYNSVSQQETEEDRLAAQYEDGEMKTFDPIPNEPESPGGRFFKRFSDYYNETDLSPNHWKMPEFEREEKNFRKKGEDDISPTPFHY